MFKQKSLVVAMMFSSVALTACNSNDDDNIGTPSQATPTTIMTTVTVTPSLGKILNGRIALKNAKTGASIAATQTITPSNNGIATFTVPTSSLTDPVLAEVLPTATGIVQYFDEALEDNKTINVPTADIAKPILRAAASVTAPPASRHRRSPKSAAPAARAAAGRHARPVRSHRADPASSRR